MTFLRSFPSTMLVLVTTSVIWCAAASPHGLEPQGSPRIPALVQANALLANCDARGALSILQKTASPYRNDARILRLEGYVLVLLHRHAEAEAVFREVLRQVPGDEYGTLELAKRLHARYAFPEARKRYQAVLDRNPDNTGARDGLKRLGQARRDFDAMAEKISRGTTNAIRAWGVFAAVILVNLVGFLLGFHRTGRKGDA